MRKNMRLSPGISKPWSIGTFVCAPEGDNIDASMLERALELRHRTRGIADPMAKTRAIFDAIDELYASLPQTWKAWSDHKDFIAGRPPDEKATFLPGDRAASTKWLQRGIRQSRTMMFLVPLEGFIRPPLAHYHVPDFPGPNDAALTT